MAALDSAAGDSIVVTCRLSGPVYGDQIVSVGADLSKPAPPEVRDDASGPFSFEYTGRHDGGELLPTSDNYYAHMVAALRDAKAKSDLILAEGVKAAASATGRPPSPKRARSVDSHPSTSGSAAATSTETAPR